MPETVRRIRPTPSDAYLGNPHKGCCTFQRFNGDELFPGTTWSEEGPLTFPPAKESVIDHYLPSTVSYCRWFWKMMKPEKGRFDFSMIDGALDTCRQRGQTLAVRLMAYGWHDQPQVPDWYAEKYPMAQRKFKSTVQHIPIHDSPEYLEHWGDFVREFARRYDNNPLLETIDITYIGPWGEGDGECSAEQCRRFAQLWKDAFKNTPRLAMIGGDQMREGIASGAGWRCDCFGDLQANGSPEVPKHLSWNHMFGAYPREVIESGATDTWKSAPIHFETCWVPMHWYERGFDIDFILEQGLKYHGTYFMPKYTALPEKWTDKLAAFCRKLGYRYVYREAIVDSRVAAGGKFRFQSWIENTGVAPIYRRYDFALRLRQSDREEIIRIPEIDIRKWMPGDVWVDEQIKMPAGFKPGWADLSAGLVQHDTREARVSFAAKEMYSDRWLPLGGIEII
jgi:hypothetical protein